MNFQDPAMLAALQGKLGELVGTSSGYVESLPAPVKRRVGALEVLQEEHAALEKQCRAEMMEIERKYEKLYAPLYEKRARIVDGTVEPTDEECGPVEGSIQELPEDSAATATNPAPSVIPADAKGIPEFWLTALKNVPDLSELITEEDEEAFKYLQDIRSTDLPDGEAGFALEFVFAENPFFTNTVLRKAYHLVDEGNYELMYDHAEGTKIDWKEGKDLSVKVEIKKQRHKGTQKVRTVKKTVPAATFFSFFSPPQQSHMRESRKCDDHERGEHERDLGDDEEEEDDLEEILEADYNLGESIKEKIIPCAVDWFTGKALQDEDEYFDDEDEDDYEEGDEDDDEEDEEDDEEDAATAAAPGAAGEKPAECKQQ